jgi:CubicO group peptidase (beta-lactamase class C family)
MIKSVSVMITLLGALSLLTAGVQSAHGHTRAEEPNAPGAHKVKALKDVEREGLTKAAAYSEKYSGRAMLVMIDGQIVFERYANGWNATKPHPLASGSKSFTGAVAAAAVQDGLLSWDELASDTITEWKGDPRKSKVTVRHLLSLSSGLDPSDALLGGRGGGRLLGQGAADRAKQLGAEKDRPNDLFKAAIDVPAKHEPGAKFEYGPSHFYAFGELLERKLEARAKADPSFKLNTFDMYMHARVLEPAGIHDSIWGKDGSGHPKLPGGCLLTARDWAKLGRFIDLDGATIEADGTRKQVINGDLIRQLFVPSVANATYGLTWWLPANGSAEATLIADGPLGDRLRQRMEANAKPPIVGPDGKPLEIRMAAGLGKQRLYVVPAFKLVVVRFAEATPEGRAFDDHEFLGPISEFAKARLEPSEVTQPSDRYPAPHPSGADR